MKKILTIIATALLLASSSAAREYAVIVPLWCSEKYDAIYSRSEMHLVEGENHLIIKRRKEIIGIILDFLHKNLGT